MKTSIFLLILALLLGLGLTKEVSARGRYSSYRIGGYTSHGKGSHYIGGYVRSGAALRPHHR